MVSGLMVSGAGEDNASTHPFPLLSGHAWTGFFGGPRAGGLLADLLF